MKRSALFLSPHLDDVAFSCSGTLIRLVDAGWKVRLCTVFTKSVSHPQGFALACQLDKGLPADVDYMALRRAEDHEFARLSGVTDYAHLPCREAPHRGYSSAKDLFEGMHDGDAIWRELAEVFAQLAQDRGLVFAPQGLGNHVDHLQVIRAVVEAGLIERTVWYADIPYAIRNPNAPPSGLLPSSVRNVLVPIDNLRKVQCCRAYRTQVPFQFGTEEDLAIKLDHFHRVAHGYAEIFLASVNNDLSSLA